MDQQVKQLVLKPQTSGSNHYAAYAAKYNGNVGILYVYTGGSHLSARFIPKAWKKPGSWKYLAQTDGMCLEASLEEIREKMDLEYVKGSLSLNPMFTIKSITRFIIESAACGHREDGSIIYGSPLTFSLSRLGETETFTIPEGFVEGQDIRILIRCWAYQRWPGISVD